MADGATKTFLGDSYDVDTVGGDFGLDNYEPEFFIRKEDWEATKWEVELTLTDTNYKKDIFYFCHIHNKMSGRIKQLDSAGKMLSTDQDPPLYSHDIATATSEDGKCGTFGLSGYFEDDHNGKCMDNYLCKSGTYDAKKTQFNKCLYAMDCHMEVNMETTADNNHAIATFIHQMIPHHQNAIQMCKALMKTDEIAASAEKELWDMCWAIINSQAAQIDLMQGWLASKNINEGSAKCSIDTHHHDGAVSSSGTAATMAGAAALFGGALLL